MSQNNSLWPILAGCLCGTIIGQFVAFGIIRHVKNKNAQNHVATKEVQKPVYPESKHFSQVEFQMVEAVERMAAKGVGANDMSSNQRVVFEEVGNMGSRCSTLALIGKLSDVDANWCERGMKARLTMVNRSIDKQYQNMLDRLEE